MADQQKIADFETQLRYATSRSEALTSVYLAQAQALLARAKAEERAHQQYISTINDRLDQEYKVGTATIPTKEEIDLNIR